MRVLLLGRGLWAHLSERLLTGKLGQAESPSDKCGEAVVHKDVERMLGVVTFAELIWFCGGYQKRRNLNAVLVDTSASPPGGLGVASVRNIVWRNQWVEIADFFLPMGVRYGRWIIKTGCLQNVTLPGK